MIKLLIIDTGAETHASIYEALLKLPVDVTICYDDTQPQRSRRQQRVEHQSERFDLPLRTIGDLSTLLADALPDRVLLLMESEKVRDFATIKLMPLLNRYRKYHDCQTSIRMMISNPPVNSLEDMLFLSADAKIDGVEIWLNAPRRYTSGMQYLYRSRSIAPLTQIRSTIDTGLYSGGGIEELMQHAWQHTDLICSILASVLPKNDEFSILPSGLSAEYSDFYRDAISVSFTCGDGDVIGSLCASTNETGNLGFRETLQVSGIGGASIELNASLSEYRYVNVDTSGPLDIDIDIDVNADELMTILKRDILGPETTNADDHARTPLQRMFLDFLETEPFRHAPTLRSCIPGIWTVDSIQRSLESSKRIDRPPPQDVKISADQQAALHTADLSFAEAFQLAHDGAFETTVDLFARLIEFESDSLEFGIQADAILRLIQRIEKKAVKIENVLKVKGIEDLGALQTDLYLQAANVPAFEEAVAGIEPIQGIQDSKAKEDLAGRIQDVLLTLVEEAVAGIEPIQGIQDSKAKEDLAGRIQDVLLTLVEEAVAGIEPIQGIQDSKAKEDLAGRIQDVLLTLVIDTTVGASSLRGTGKFLRNLYRIFSR